MKLKPTEYYVNKYLRKDLLPTMFCPGCGNINVLNILIRAIDNIGLDQNKLVFVSGIGCSSRLPAYIDADGFHTVHGRAIPVATGIKVTNPDLHVIVLTGDGDLSAIGMSHFLHAIRRNIGITVICINNENYGMTGGQASPTTPLFDISPTTPYKNIEHSFNLSAIAKSAGANFVARWTVAHSHKAIKSMEKALTKNGFAFVEMLSSCPIGKKDKFKSPREIIKYYQNESVLYKEMEDLDLSSERAFEKNKDLFSIIGKEGKMIIGEFVDIERTSYQDLYASLKEDAKSYFLNSIKKL